MVGAEAVGSVAVARDGDAAPGDARGTGPQERGGAAVPEVAAMRLGFPDAEPLPGAPSSGALLCLERPPAGPAARDAAVAAAGQAIQSAEVAARRSSPDEEGDLMAHPEEQRA